MIAKIKAINKINIRPELVAAAHDRISFDKYNDKSFRGGAGNIYGALGELLAIERFKRLGRDVQDLTTFNFDLLVNGCKVDIKTRVSNKPPRPWFRLNIPAYSIGQKTEFYYFIYINKEMSEAWHVGGVSKDEFIKLARFYRAGEPDGHKFRFSCDTYQVTLRQLKKP